jgi:hypothetical protein
MGSLGCERNAIIDHHPSSQRSRRRRAIKEAKTAETAVDVSKLVSQTKNVLNYNKIKPFFQTIYHQVIKGPITETIRSFKKQWENLLENVGSALIGPQLAADGVGVVPSGRVIGIDEESARSVRFSMNQAVDGVAGKRTSQAVADKVVKTDIDIIAERANKAGLDLTPKTCPYKQLGRKGKKKLKIEQLLRKNGRDYNGIKDLLHVEMQA